MAMRGITGRTKSTSAKRTSSQIRRDDDWGDPEFGMEVLDIRYDAICSAFTEGGQFCDAFDGPTLSDRKSRLLGVAIALPRDRSGLVNVAHQ